MFHVRVPVSQIIFSEFSTFILPENPMYIYLMLSITVCDLKMFRISDYAVSPLFR